MSTPKPSREFPDQETRLRLSWRSPDTEGAALIFSKDAWALFEHAAEMRGICAEEMISVAVAQLLGRINWYRRKE